MLIDYQLSGYVKNLSGFFQKMDFKKANFIYSIGNKKGKISSLNGTINQIPVNSGEISFIKDKIIAINSTIKSDLELDQNKLKQIFPSTKFFSSNNQVFLKGNITSLLNLEFDNSFKVKKFDLNFKGKILESFLKLEKPLEYITFKEKIDKVKFKNTDVLFTYNNKKEKKITLEGKYILDETPLNFYFLNKFNETSNDINLNIDIINSLNFPIINYEKKAGLVANLDTNFKIKKNNINFEKINFLDGKSSIYANNILIDNKGVVKSFKDIKIKTFQNNKINNDFSITSKNGLNIKGKIYDLKCNKIISSKIKQIDLKI